VSEEATPPRREVPRRAVLKATAAGALAATVPAARIRADETLRFPPGFVWGTATSSYQVEGRGDRIADSIWDTFCRLPGVIHDRSNGDVACDHYHRYPEDIALMGRGGIKAYRYSISWPRVLPDGTGQPDQKGLDFYSRLTDALLRAGIEPWVCLFHWDLPQALQDRGGWTTRAIADWYADYAGLMARHLGDRVTRWVMFNEAAVHAIMGHGLGEHAPGFKSREMMAQAAHHQNLAQGKGLAALRALGGTRFQLGTVLGLQPVRPSDGLAENREAAAMWDAVWNRAYLDPLFYGRYPARFAPLVDDLVQPGDLTQIRQPVDFIGVNYYGPMYQKADPKGLVGTNWGANPPSLQLTAMGWPVDPNGLSEILADLRDHYGNPRLYVTENGAFFNETAGPSGHVDDRERIAYLRDHIHACHLAIAQGVNLHGYFIWTIMDNWEWAYGYTARFGLARVDHATLARIPKASFDWFARIAGTNGL
jgi:beta-glucosidase